MTPPDKRPAPLTVTTDRLAALRLAWWTLAAWVLRVPLCLASWATWQLQAAEAWAVRRRECARMRRASTEGGDA